MKELRTRLTMHEGKAEKEFERIDDRLGKHDEQLGEIETTLENHSCRLSAAETGIKANNALIWKVIAAIMTALAGTQMLTKFTGGIF